MTVKTKKAPPSRKDREAVHNVGTSISGGPARNISRMDNHRARGKQMADRDSVAKAARKNSAVDLVPPPEAELNYGGFWKNASPEMAFGIALLCALAALSAVWFWVRS